MSSKMKDKYGLIGYPLSHSFSKRYFREKFDTNHIPAEYQNFELSTIMQFPDLFQKGMSLKGLNVTIPYKEAIIPFLDELDADARSIGAVNCIKFENNKLIGYNTDHTGFQKSIQNLLQAHHRKALVFGSGGSSKSIEFALEKLNIEYKVVSRNYTKINSIRYQNIDEQILKEYTILINCTPLGMYPNNETCIPINFDAIGPQHLLYDLVYNPEESLFLSRGKKQGAIVKNGYEMLTLQADESWHIWNS
jgi:shikimate dehydrogenase